MKVNLVRSFNCSSVILFISNKPMNYFFRRMRILFKNVGPKMVDFSRKISVKALRVNPKFGKLVLSTNCECKLRPASLEVSIN